MKEGGKVQDATDEDAFQDASGVNRVKRYIDPDRDPGRILFPEDIISTESAEVPAATNGDAIINAPPLHVLHATTEDILKTGFQNLTSKLDNILENMDTIPSLVDRWVSLKIEGQRTKEARERFFNGSMELGNATDARGHGTDAKDHGMQEIKTGADGIKNNSDAMEDDTDTSKNETGLTFWSDAAFKVDVGKKLSLHT